MKKMVLLAAAPELFKRGIDPMKATTAQVMNALRAEQRMSNPTSELGFLFDLVSRGHIKKPWVPELGMNMQALPELLGTAKVIDPRVEKLPIFPELTAIARRAVQSPPNAP
jgi:hypothetical protein